MICPLLDAVVQWCAFKVGHSLAFRRVNCAESLYFFTGPGAGAPGIIAFW